MIISERKNFIFFAIPKTGSSTIHLTLEEFYDAPRRYSYHKLPEDFFSNIKNMRYLSLYKFTFVRNPYDRLFAQYLERLKHINQTEAYLKNESNFNLIVKNNPELLNCPAFTRVYNKFNYSFYHQMHYWTHKNNTSFMDYIGYQERFEQDFKEVCDRLELNIKEIKNANNKTEIKRPCDPFHMSLSDYKYLDQYDPETIALINKSYKKDFELFGYPMIDPNEIPSLSDKNS